VNADSGIVPLELAVQHIFREVYGPCSSPDKLNGLAMAIAALTPIYQGDQESKELLRCVPAAAALSGMFRGGGKELRFIDGRSPLTGLCLRVDDISYVIGVLRQSIMPDTPPFSPDGARPG
jgi:hypothetical protein